ncbi:MAG: DUF4097 family beta strand repeat protein [Bacilli bacterium]|nr:DUF4097 family beta strand repeat protein [Bacilli bacterium]
MNNKGLIITLISVLSVIAVGLIVGMVLLMTKKFDFSFDFGKVKKLKLVANYEAKVEEINKIDFNLYSTDVEIKESTDELIKVEYYSNKEKNADIKQEGNTIIVNEEEKGNYCIGFCFNNRKIVLYIPSTYEGMYSLETKSGDIVFEIDASKSNIEIDTASGDVLFKNANDVDILTISGDVKGEISNKTKIHSTSGDIKIKEAKESSDIKTTSGDIYVGKVTKTTINSISGDVKVDKVTESMNIKTVSGDVLVATLEMKQNSNINTTSGDVIINNNASNCYVEFDSTSGDKNVNHSDRKSDLILKVHTVSGDLLVD